MRACTVAAETAHQLGLGVNAGHDLDHRNLVRFRELPHLDEVSIGHALISRALFDGLSAHRAGAIWTCFDDQGIGGARRGGRPVRLSHRVDHRRPTGAVRRLARHAPRCSGCRSGAVDRRGSGRGQGSAPAEAPKLDQAKIDGLRKRAADNPRDAAVRAEIGNAYFDAERYPEAITWYEASLGLDAKNVDVSTDLGVSYYYANQADRALAQFERSLQIEPKHTKTMLNIGVVRAFGKQDLTGAASIWQQVVDIAPESAEGRAAKRMIEAVRSAHPEAGGPAGGAPGAKPQENGAS